MTDDLSMVLADCDDAAATLRHVTTELNEADLRAPSILPDWSRGHVLAHITDAGDAVARQAEYARRGELIEFYDGGREGRNAAIETGATLPLPDRQRHIDRMLERVSRAWPGPESSLWDRPVRYRDGTVVDVVLTWWREIRIHLVDLDVGVGAQTWSAPFCRHLFEFLTPRLPSDVPVELHFDAAGTWWVRGSGRTGPALVIEGDLRDIALWLAGRAPKRMPEASSSGEPATLPVLQPWPSSRG